MSESLLDLILGLESLGSLVIGLFFPLFYAFVYSFSIKSSIFEWLDSIIWQGQYRRGSTKEDSYNGFAANYLFIVC